MDVLVIIINELTDFKVSFNVCATVFRDKMEQGIKKSPLRGPEQDVLPLLTIHLIVSRLLLRIPFQAREWFCFILQFKKWSLRRFLFFIFFITILTHQLSSLVNTFQPSLAKQALLKCSIHLTPNLHWSFRVQTFFQVMGLSLVSLPH